MSAAPSREATLLGLGAVAIWGSLALLTTLAGRLPPFQLVAATSLVGAVVILAVAAARGRLRSARPTLPSLALGLFGLLGDTALYYAAMGSAPPAEANLVHYLWPLLIVLFAALGPGGRLRPRHLAGAVLGLAGVVAVVGGGIASLQAGHLYAAAGAVVWALYSVLARAVAGVPSESLGVTLLVVAATAAAVHLAFETTGTPAGPGAWAALLALGIGPMGGAFLLWDIGCKRGDVSFLGVASYSAPVISTLSLVAAGLAPAGPGLLVGCVLVVAGALVASRGR